MTIKLIGMDDATPYAYGGDLYQSVCRFQAEKTGTMTQFKVKCNASGYMSYAVYADSSGSPYTRLAQQATPQAVVSGWNTLSIAPVSLVAGNYYWLAVYPDATGRIGYNLSGGTRKYKSGASTFSNPFDGTGFTNDSIPVFAAGWGYEIVLKNSEDGGNGVETVAGRALEIIDQGYGMEAGLAGASIVSGDEGSANETGGLLESLAGSDDGAGKDAIRILTRKTGADLKLQSHRGRLAMPDKEVSL